MGKGKAFFAVGLAIAPPLAVFAQGGSWTAPQPGLAATDWAPAYAKPLDGEAVVSATIWDRLTAYSKASDPATPAEKRRYIGEADAVVMIKALRDDSKLTASEIDLLEELALPKTRTIHIQRTGDAKSRVLIQPLSGLMQPSANELAAMWRTEWDKAAADGSGWTVLLSADSKTAAGHESLRHRLNMGGRDHFSRVVSESNFANKFEPFRVAILKLYTSMIKLPVADQARAKAMVAEAAKAADEYHGGKAPDYLYNWLAPKV